MWKKSRWSSPARACARGFPRRAISAPHSSYRRTSPPPKNHLPLVPALASGIAGLKPSANHSCERIIFSPHNVLVITLSRLNKQYKPQLPKSAPPTAQLRLYPSSCKIQPPKPPMNFQDCGCGIFIPIHPRPPTNTLPAPLSPLMRIA